MSGVYWDRPATELFVLNLAIAVGLALLVLALFLVTVVMALHFRHARRARRWRNLETDWEPLVLDMLADPTVVSASVLNVEPDEELFLLDFLARLARRLRGGEAETLQRLARPFMGRLVQQGESLLPENRAHALWLLSTLGLPDQESRVLAALDDPSDQVAMTAARALARRGDPRYAGEILKRLHRFTAWNPRHLAALLANVGPAAAPDLRATLADTTTPESVRAVAAAALGTLRDLAAAPVANTVLETTNDRDLAAWCIILLGTVGRPQDVPVLRSRASSADPVLRARALEALGRLGDTTDAALLDAALEDPSPWVCLAAAHGLVALGQIGILQDRSNRSDSAGLVAREALAGVAAT